MDFKVGDLVQVQATGHTYHGTLYQTEAVFGSIGEVSELNDDGTVRVWWVSHPDGFEGLNDDEPKFDTQSHSQADVGCLRLHNPVDVSSIDKVEAYLNG